MTNRSMFKAERSSLRDSNMYELHDSVHSQFLAETKSVLMPEHKLTKAKLKIEKLIDDALDNFTIPEADEIVEKLLQNRINLEKALTESIEHIIIKYKRNLIMLKLNLYNTHKELELYEKEFSSHKFDEIKTTFMAFNRDFQSEIDGIMKEAEKPSSKAALKKIKLHMEEDALDKFKEEIENLITFESNSFKRILVFNMIL